MTDERQRIQAWSSVAQRMLGYAPEEVVGKPCYRVMMGREVEGHPVCGPNSPVTRNARRGRGTAAYEVIVQARDGSPRCVQSSVLEGQRRGFRVIHLLREGTRNHIASVQRKLGVRNRLDMVLQGMRRGLV